MSVANNLIGKTLSNRYEILRPLGEGGMGKVYLAKDKRFGKQVVVKVPTMEAGDKDFKDRFMREIASLATLEHAHIVTTVDWGEIEGIPFLVLRYLSGGSLRDRITDSQGFYKPMPLEGLSQWLPQIASALDFIHTKNWVHRDLKPDNILFDEAGNPYLADFGIAKALEGAPMGVKTTMGAFIGTPQYMAPEMHLGKSIGPRADQFGLAVLVYEALAGKIPFAGATPTAIFVEVMQGKAKPIHELVPGIPLEKSNALMKGITKEPRDRYGSCVEFANAITGSMLARGSSSAGSETPSRVVIPGTRMETPKKPDILGTRIETPSKPEIAGTRMEIPSKPEIVVIKKETHSKPKIAETMLEKSGSKPVIAGTRLERSGVKVPVIKESEEKSEEELPYENRSEKRGNYGGVLVLAAVLGGAALLGIILIMALNGRKATTAAVNNKSNEEEGQQVRLKQEEEAKVKQVKLKQEEEVKAKQMELVKLKQEEDAKFVAIEKEMVLIPAGKFSMGSPRSEKARLNDESQHEVTITKPFYMGKYEVSQEQWEAVMGKNSSSTEGATLPVTNVSWLDCQEFVKKLNAKTSGGYRLPKEAEWEYACRAGTTTDYSFGDSVTKSDANVYGSSTKAVGSYKPNAFGLYDMHGNVWEWCEDWKADYPAGSVTDSMGPATGTSRVLRGGSFGANELVAALFARSSNRYFDTPNSQNYSYGFRLVRTADLKAAVVPTATKPDPAAVMPASGNLLVAPFTEAKAKEVQKEIAKSLQKEVEEKEDLGQGIKLEMVLIPAGKFMMGSFALEEGRSKDENEREVTLPKPFYMGKYEVTQEQWEAVMGNNPSRDKKPKLPVTKVTWNDTHEFIKKLNAKTNNGYRLPSEAEWEYACRAGTRTMYSFGDKITKTDCNFKYSFAEKPIEVGSYKPNRFGLYDMHGNVWEYCEDWYLSSYPQGEMTDPKGPEIGQFRVTRGGAFYNIMNDVRSATRAFKVPDSVEIPTNTSFGNEYIGFRLARTTNFKTGVSPTVTKPDPAVVMPATANLLAGPFTETKAKEVQKEVAKSLKKEVEEKADLGKGIKLEMVLIPSGKFVMGSPASETDRRGDETQHEVTLTKHFYMGKYEITQEQWEAVMGKNPSSRTKGAKLPVTNVSWEDCQEFINKLNTKTNGGYRLSTEAEWEYACRAGTKTAYSVGDSLTKSDANNGEGSAGSIKPVGSYKPNAFGLYDMHGNVREWCEDWYSSLHDGEVIDPKGPATGINRVMRGGSFFAGAYNARSSFRATLSTPATRGIYVGFRLARTP